MGMGPNAARQKQRQDVTLVIPLPTRTANWQTRQMRARLLGGLGAMHRADQPRSVMAVARIVAITGLLIVTVFAICTSR